MVNFKYFSLTLVLPTVLQAENVQMDAIQFFDPADDINLQIPEELASFKDSVQAIGRVNLQAFNTSYIIPVPEKLQNIDPSLLVNELVLGIDCSQFKCLKYENSLIPTMPVNSLEIRNFYQEHFIPPEAENPFISVDNANVLPDPLRDPVIMAKRAAAKKLNSRAKLGMSDYEKPLSRRRRMTNPRPVEKYPGSTVSLEIRKKGQYSMSTCTGSILHERVILTAAHCIVSREQKVFFPPNYNQIYDLDSITINVGVTERDFSNYDIRYFNRNLYKSEQRIVLSGSYLAKHNVEKNIKINNHWLRSLGDKKLFGLKHGDIALIILPENQKIVATSARKIKPVKIYAPGWHTPIPIPDYNEEYNFRAKKDLTVEVIGYGKTTSAKNPTFGLVELGRNFFRVINKKDAQSHIRNIGWAGEEDLTNVQDMFFGLGYYVENANSQVCSGDSGGPVFIGANLLKVFNGTLWQFNEPAQLGLTCWVDGNCDRNFNGFMELGKYLDWIRDNVDQKIWSSINDNIVPNKFQVELYLGYKDALLKWRATKNAQDSEKN